jgi:arginyl-tRNA--protein-N-Asp/Glu arginylyltransferase
MPSSKKTGEAGREQSPNANTDCFTVTICDNIVRPYGYSKSECGYCKGKRSFVLLPTTTTSTTTDVCRSYATPLEPEMGTEDDSTMTTTTTTAKDSSKSYSVLVESMTPEVYEQFMYRGWRRSGIHLYKPCNFESCCPTMTIRLPVQEYQPTKSQAQIPIKLYRRLQKTAKSNSNSNSKSSSHTTTTPTTTATTASVQTAVTKTIHQETLLAANQRILQILQDATRQVLLDIFNSNDQLAAHIHLVPLSPKFKIMAPSKKKQKQFHRASSSSSSSTTSTIPTTTTTPTSTTSTESLNGNSPNPTNDPTPIPTSSSASTSMLVQVSTGVCAQLAALKDITITRGELAQYVKQKLMALSSSSSHPLLSQIVKIEHHGPSGQVIVDLQVDRTTTTTSGHQEQSAAQPLQTQQAQHKQQVRYTDPMDVDVDNDYNNDDDPLNAWYQFTFHKPPLPPNADRSITRTMIPAHESALDPRVHQLYVMYQHQVHGDADPFVPAVAVEIPQEQVESSMASSPPPPIGPTAKIEPNDGLQSQTPSSIDDDMDVTVNRENNDSANDLDENDYDHQQHQQHINASPGDTSMGIKEDDEGEAISDTSTTTSKAAHPITLLSQLDWGLAPSDWKKRVRVMMEKYLEESVVLASPSSKASGHDGILENDDNHKNHREKQNDEKKRQQTELQTAVIQHYYGFYQFLVESPFPLITTINKNSHANRMNNNNHEQQTSDSTVGVGDKDTLHQQQQQQQQKPRPLSLQYGTYHQHYTILDNILVAVGVIDVLPSGVSSVYLFYHPTLGRYLKGGVALGKYAIVQEIEYTKSIVQLPYYYLGYYIESCQKMRYKADYRPSQLLCPTHYEWVDATGTAIPMLQQSAPRHVCTLYDPPPTAPPSSAPPTQALPDNDLKENSQSPPLPPQQQQKQWQGGTARSGAGSGTGAAATSAVSSKKQKKTTKETQDDDILEQVQMDIGAANIKVTIGMLQESGQQLVRPLLDEFVREAGLELAKQCILKLA